MNMLKKSLAMFLALCMLFSAAPMTVFAEEIDSTNPIVTEATEETTAPAETVPETTVALETVPETTVALETAPQETAPQETVPQETVPQETVPQETVPQETVPQETVPQETVPQETVPQETVPQETVPQETVSQEMISQDLLPQVTVPQVNDPLSVITTGVDADIAPTATTTSNKPADGTSSAQPFPMNVIGTGHYRIPAFVTTKNGTLVAAADARWHVWDTTDDNGDIDTIVSRSTDNGATWNYSFANYIDNGNTTNYGAATFIDPALAYDGKTIYMIVDLYPGQSGQTNCTGSSKTGTGYDSNGNLLLGTSATASSSELKYYLSGGKILDATGKDQGYTVDAWFNVKDSAGNSCGNLFDYDNTCGFHPLMTSHLYLTKSTDNGATWSAPVMLNPQLKKSSDTYYLVSPGRGIVTSDGTIIFGAYDNSGQTSLIYSTNGVNWYRSANSGFTSSEDEIVELSNGTLRMFYRYGYSSSGTVRYVDITKNSDGSYSWGSPVSTSASFNGNVNISAISYSKTAGGKQVILVSCPADTSGTWNRYNGYIYTFTFDGTNMNLVASYDVDSSSSKDVFSYSCLTEQANGSIGMLYEKGDSGSITYINLKAETVTGLTFDEETTEPSTPSQPDTDTDITVADEAITVASATAVTKIDGLTDFVAYDVTLTKNGANYKDAATITIPLNGKFGADVTLWGFVLETDGTVKYVEDAVRDYEKDTLTFLAPHFSTVGGTPAKAADTGDGTLSDTVASSGGSATTYVLDKDGLDVNAQYLIVYDGNALTNTKGSLAVTVNGDNATPSGDATGALWKYTATVWYETHYSPRLSNGSNYLYTSVSGNWNNRQYNLVVDGNDETLTITSNNNGTYTVYRRSSSINTYVNYNSGWTASTSPQNLSFYKYTAGSEAWTVDAALQESRIASLTVSNDSYTAASWSAYQAALTAAQNKLASVEATNYASKAAANTALNELIQQVEDLETAKNNLKKAIIITINYKAGGTTVATSTLTVTSDDTTVTLPKQVTGKDGKIYAVDNTTLALTDATSYNVKVSETKAVNVTVENTPFTGHTGAEGVGKKISNLIIGTGTTYDLNVEGEVVWGTTSDKITVDQNGSVTGVTATGDDETVYVTATVNGVIYQLPVTVLDVQTSGSTRTVDFYSQEVLNCTAYYSYQGNDLVEFPEGSEFYVVHSKAQTDIVSFFATPDPGYAVTYANGTGGTYFHVVKNADGTSFGYESSGNSCNHSLQMKTGGYDYAHDQLIAYVVNNSRALTADQVHTMLNYAVAKNCDAMFFFSRAANEANMNSSTTFIAEKLPTFDKTVDGVLPASGKQADYRRYVPGMVATVGEMVYFKITVTLERPLTWKNEATGVGPINYTNAWVEDTFLTGAYLYTKELDQKDGKWDGIVDEAYRVQKDDITAKLNAAWAADETQRTIELYLVYTVTQADIAHNTLFNTADLSYTYQSHYSKGASTQEADATASIDMMGALMGSIVIDFGLPVTYTASAAELSGATRGSAKYGSVEVDPQNDGSYLVTYTPNQILPAVDTVSLYDNDGNLINAFQVLPATTVYYEEGFLFTDTSKIVGTWKYLVDNELPENQVSNKGRGTQDAVVLGHAGTNNFGYDDHYAGTTTDPMKGSDGTWAMSDAVGDTTSFTFTGTGFQLYANSDTGSGIVSVYSKGGIQRIYTIDTGLKVPTAGKNGSTISPNSLAQDVKDTKTYYSLPVVSETNLPYGTYIVTIRHTKDSKPIYLDGVRIFNTLESSTVFTSDLEDNPVFHELRDHVLNAIGVEDLTESDYIGGDDNGNDRQGKIDAVKDMAGQVYNAGIDGNAVVINVNGTLFNGQQAQELLDDGPKNELYLYPGQTLVFSVDTNRVMQLGLKSPTGDAKFTITVDGTELDLKSLSTTVDMFYKIAAKGGTTHNVTITVTSGVLSVTTLKVCDDPSFSFNTLTQEDIENALLGIFGLDKVENPFVDVVEDDFFYNAVLWAHENGITNGMDDTHFIATGMCNRAQIVTFLWRAMGKPAPTTTVNPFVDVTESDFFYDAVLWAYENGITTGVDATHFNPTGQCNRAQAVTFLWRAVGEPESTADVDFTDVQPSQFYSAAVAWAFEKGITNGMGDGTFGVLESCNRAQVVTFLYRALAPR